MCKGCRETLQLKPCSDTKRFSRDGTRGLLWVLFVSLETAGPSATLRSGRDDKWGGVGLVELVADWGVAGWFWFVPLKPNNKGI
jgi:hypothetical protein